MATEKLETLQRPEYLSAEYLAKKEWLRYLLKKALEDAGFTPDDAKISEVVGTQSQSMDDLIEIWKLESNELVQDRTSLLEKKLGDVAKDRVRNMAIGSVRLEKRKYVESSKVAASSDDELLALLKNDDGLLNALHVDPAVAKKYALWILDKEVYLPEIPVIIDMAIGGAYFRVFKERSGFHS
ncbi:hypothetical protein PsorP6_000716 [Peronosclerospora sorghi]|uniref:Uncharacterized protein n=1 Tax=Peronosclerospora sorghi TaxID=230839 RepID=A0ACC0WPE7_9STRA|nr:hypothetical protein PsorP6_000716 [Peronosclerospora sorghi]